MCLRITCARGWGEGDEELVFNNNVSVGDDEKF